LAQNYDDLPVVEDLSGVTVDDEDLFGVNYRLRKAQKLKLKQQVTIVSLRIYWCASVLRSLEPQSPKEIVSWSRSRNYKLRLRLLSI
jgi:hypothetical protein